MELVKPPNAKANINTLISYAIEEGKRIA